MTRGNSARRSRPIAPDGHKCAPPDATGLAPRTPWVCPTCGMYWAVGISWSDWRRNRRRRKAAKNATREYFR